MGDSLADWRREYGEVLGPNPIILKPATRQQSKRHLKKEFKNPHFADVDRSPGDSGFLAADSLDDWRRLYGQPDTRGRMASTMALTSDPQSVPRAVKLAAIQKRAASCKELILRRHPTLCVASDGHFTPRQMGVSLSELLRTPRKSTKASPFGLG